jgi:hypothetical protein
MSDLKLGQLVDASQTRDAIHVAVAPVIAGHILKPGEHVGWIDEEVSTVGRTTDKFGIVDPFLVGPIMPGQRFMVVLYPQSVTKLRHEWDHPAFTQTNHAQINHAAASEQIETLRAHAAQAREESRELRSRLDELRRALREDDDDDGCRGC